MRQRNILLILLLWSSHSFASAHLVNFEGKRAWMKTVPIEKQTLSFCAKKKWAALLSPLAMARPTTTCGLGILRLEASRLQELAKLGVPVPALFKDSNEYLIIEDRGLNLEKIVGHAVPENRLELLLKAVAAIKDLHAFNTTHGRAMLKDMVMNASGQISFIDLAEDPLSHMTLPQAQARDWLMFLFSSLPFCTLTEQMFLIQKTHKAMAPETSKEFQRAKHLLKKLQIFIRFINTHGGKDGKRLALLARVMLREFER